MAGLSLEFERKNWTSKVVSWSPYSLSFGSDFAPLGPQSWIERMRNLTLIDINFEPLSKGMLG